MFFLQFFYLVAKFESSSQMHCILDIIIKTNIDKYQKNNIWNKFSNKSLIMLLDCGLLNLASPRTPSKEAMFKYIKRQTLPISSLLSLVSRCISIVDLEHYHWSTFVYIVH